MRLLAQGEQNQQTDFLAMPKHTQAAIPVGERQQNLGPDSVKRSLAHGARQPRSGMGIVAVPAIQRMEKVPSSTVKRKSKSVIARPKVSKSSLKTLLISG